MRYRGLDGKILAGGMDRRGFVNVTKTKIVPKLPFTVNFTKTNKK